MTKTIRDKREREKEVVGRMIALYCSKQHKKEHTLLEHRQKKQGLCTECRELFDYACGRSELCPFMETKTFCSNCRVHCYQDDMREKIRQVMRFAGPRIILYHPLLAIRHMMESKKEKGNGKVKNRKWKNAKGKNK